MKKKHINPNQTNNMGGGEGNTPFNQYYTKLTLFNVRSLGQPEEKRTLVKKETQRKYK